MKREPACYIGPIGKRRRINILNHNLFMFGNLYKKADALVNYALKPHKDYMAIAAMDLFYGFTASGKPNLALIELSNTNPGLMFYGPKAIVKIAKYRDPDLDVENLATPGYDARKAITRCFIQHYANSGGKGKPMVGIITGPRTVTSFMMDHEELQKQLHKEGVESMIITPENDVRVENKQLIVDGTRIELAFLRLSDFSLMADFYKIPLPRILSLDTKWVNNPESIKLRSKKIAERELRKSDTKGKRVNRPKTLIDNEISPESVSELFNLYSGVVTKPSEGSGGKGIMTYVDNGISNRTWNKHYPKDFLLLGEGIVRLAQDDFSTMSNWIAQTSDLVSGLIKPDVFIHQGVPRIFDMRLYLAYYDRKYHIISGLSRVASTVGSQLNIITNVSRGIGGSGAVPLLIYPEKTDLEYTSELMRKFA